MFTRVNLLAFALGTALLQQQAQLPTLTALWLLWLLPICFVIWRYFDTSLTFSIDHRIAGAVIFLAAGFSWAGLTAHSRLADTLPAQWEGTDIQLIGVIAGLPQRHDTVTRFRFDVEQILTEDAYIPKHITLS